jgi:hypothetical protein
MVALSADWLPHLSAPLGSLSFRRPWRSPSPALRWGTSTDNATGTAGRATKVRLGIRARVGGG